MSPDRGRSAASLTAPGRVLIVALGSGGDVYPLLALGRELRARGHEVAMATTSDFESAVVDAGLEYSAIGDDLSRRETEQDPDLWKFPQGVKILFGRLTDAVPPTYQFIADRYEPGRTVVVSNFLAFGARVAREKLGVPLATVHLSPVMLRSLHAQPGRVVDPKRLWLVRPLRRVFTFLMDRYLFDPVLSPRLNAFRSDLGLPPHSRWMKSWIHSPDLVLGLFPEWFAERQPDWPACTALTGFPLADVSAQPELAPEVEEFLGAGEPPIVFTFGTAMAFGREFFEASVEACRRLVRRGLLLTRFDEQVPSHLPADVQRFRYVPLGRLLPRAAALVHHGGVGTMAQALAAGCPQLITPMNFDQPDNAARVEALGVGLRLRPKDYSAARAAAKLEDLLHSAHIAEKSRKIAARFQSENPVERSCERIESLLGKSG
ncbi:MAG: glycosyltransferase [Acidobacteria bacterium]|nr:glycosyltransferase [Acidobacteriota bacterium]